jgi:anion-transporting  ArsA/GET3 family ATPase
MSSGRRPRVLVCAGGGGVGKTSTSAALALAAAHRGERALVVTIDPARRLADALGIKLGPMVQRVELEAGDGALYALMPDPRLAMRTFVEFLFAHRPRSLERVLSNRMYKVMEDAVPGVHELVAMSLVTQALSAHELDLVVIDTAPSRNALDFITYPKRLAELLRGRAMGWLAQLAHQRAARGESDEGDEMKPRGRVMRLLEKGLGPVIYDVGALSAELVGVIDRFATLNEQSSTLLLGPMTRYLLVAAPTRAAEDDAKFLYRRLDALKVRPHAVILNATVEPEPSWTGIAASDPMREAIDVLASERIQRAEATAAMIEAVSRIRRKLAPICLPYLGPAPPGEIVIALSRALSVHLADLT